MYLSPGGFQPARVSARPIRSDQNARKRALECYPELETWNDGSWTQSVFSCGWSDLRRGGAVPLGVRIFMEWTVIIGDWSVLMWASWIALVVAGGPPSSRAET
jgi:hypothetical protein